MAANDRQVGGSHYSNGQADLQHWDLVVKYDWDYFQGQVTKYLMRWKKKGLTPEARLQDLEKALHFLEKYVEVERGKLPKKVTASDVVIMPNRVPLGESAGLMSLADFEHGNPRYLSNEQFRCEGGYGSGVNLYTCLKCKHLARHTSLENAMQDHVCSVPATPGTPPAV